MAPDDRARRRQAGGCCRVNGTGHLGEARDRRVLAWWSDGLQQRRLVEVLEAYPLHGVEVIEVAPIFLEAMRRRQSGGVIAQMILSELTSRVAEIDQELGERRSARPQVGRT